MKLLVIGATQGIGRLPGWKVSRPEKYHAPM